MSNDLNDRLIKLLTTAKKYREQIAKRNGELKDMETEIHSILNELERDSVKVPELGIQYTIMKETQSAPTFSKSKFNQYCKEQGIEATDDMIYTDLGLQFFEPTTRKEHIKFFAISDNQKEHNKSVETLSVDGDILNE